MYYVVELVASIEVKKNKIILICPKTFEDNKNNVKPLKLVVLRQVEMIAAIVTFENLRMSKYIIVLYSFTFVNVHS